MSEDSLIDDFKLAMSAWPSGVTVVTTRHNDELWGFTASSFCSLSLEPPMVLVCLNSEANCHDAFADAEKFAVNVLSGHQGSLSQVFASKDIDKFEHAAVVDSRNGLPTIERSTATIECKRIETLRRGDHSILLGEVLAATASDEQPLVYFRRGLHRL